MYPIKSLKTNEFLFNLKLKNISNCSLLIDDSIIETKDRKKDFNFTNRAVNLITYFICLSFSKSNIFLHIMDCLGNEIYFYSAGSFFKLKRKQIKQIDVLNKFSEILLTKFAYLKNTTLALQINNNNNLNSVRLFIKQIKNKLLLTLVKVYISYPYNGCRKKGKMAEWFKAVDCKSIEFSHRRFESYFLLFTYILLLEI